jgi:hypothetical protein
MSGRNRAQWRRAVEALAAAHGRSVEATAGGHLRLIKDGAAPIYTASTPSDWRALANTRAQLRRMDREAGEARRVRA